MQSVAAGKSLGQTNLLSRKGKSEPNTTDLPREILVAETQVKNKLNVHF